MSRTLTAPQTTLLEGANRAHHQRVWIADALGELVEYTDYLLPGTVHEQGVNEAVDALTLHFDRSLGASSLSPLMTAEKPIDLGRAVVWETAVTSQTADPVEGDWMEMFRGSVRLVDPTTNDMVVLCQDLAGTLRELMTLPGQTYAADTELEAAIQAALSAAPGASGITLDVPVSPDASLTTTMAQPHEPLLQAAQTLADAIGWSARYWWHDVGEEFRFSLLSPPRDKVTPDWVTGPDRYLAVRELKLDKTDIRNHVTVYYGPPLADGEQASVVVEDAASIAKYGLLPLILREGSLSPIQNAGQATVFGGYAVADLSEPDATHAVEDFDLPHIQIWDLIEFAANDVHYNSVQRLAVQSIRREYPAPGVARITLGCRGKPSAGVGAWKRRERAGRFGVTTTSNPAALYGLIDFREIEASGPGKRRWGWTSRGTLVDTVWSADAPYTTPFVLDDAWSLAAALVLPLPADQDWVEVDVPAGDQNVLLQVEPRLADLSVSSADVIERVQLYPVPTHIDVTLTAAIVNNLVDLSLTLKAADSSMPYPATANIYEGTAAGTLLATFTYSADGTKTKIDDADLGGRALPASGRKVWTAVVTDRVGTVYAEEVVVDPPRLPYFDGIRSVLAVNLLSVDIFGTVIDPAGLGGTLEFWLPANVTTPADPSAAATGSVVIGSGSMPFAINPSSVTAFDNVVTAGNAFTVVLKFTASDGRTTGKQPFPIAGSMQFLVDNLGLLRAGSVYNGLVLAQAYRPYFLGTGAPSSAPSVYGTDRYFDTAALTAYLHNGSAWVVDATTPAVSYAPILRAGVVTAEVLAATAVRAKLVGAERITTDNMAVDLSLTVGQYIGSTSYTAGSVGWRILADGTVEFNAGTFRGVVRIGSSSIYDGGYDPSTKETPGGAQSKADAAQSTAISTASADATSKANAALAAASVIIRSNSAPTTRSNGSALVQGDQWIDTDAGNKPWIWNSSAWTESYTEIDGGSIKTGAIQSTIYSAGVSGWTIGMGGSAEFNNVTVRGTVAAGLIGDANGQIRFGSNAYAITASRWIDFLPVASGGTGVFVQHGAISLFEDGSGTYSGALSAASGTFAGTVSAGAIVAAGAFTAQYIDLAEGGGLILRPDETFGVASVTWLAGATGVAQIVTSDLLGDVFSVHAIDTGRHLDLGVTSDTKLRIEASTPSSTQTWLQVKLGSSSTFHRVSVGAAGSGGSGLRALCVPN